jgi:hypothetical protein
MCYKKLVLHPYSHKTSARQPDRTMAYIHDHKHAQKRMRAFVPLTSLSRALFVCVCAPSHTNERFGSASTSGVRARAHTCTMPSGERAFCKAATGLSKELS